MTIYLTHKYVTNVTPGYFFIFFCACPFTVTCCKHLFKPFRFAQSWLIVPQSRIFRRHTFPKKHQNLWWGGGGTKSPKNVKKYHNTTFFGLDVRNRTVEAMCFFLLYLKLQKASPPYTGSLSKKKCESGDCNTIYTIYLSLYVQLADPILFRGTAGSRKQNLTKGLRHSKNAINLKLLFNG